MMYIRCLDCEHCNEIKKKCYPKSLDCNSEYDLSDEEIYEYNETKCDFYKKTVGLRDDRPKLHEFIEKLQN